MIDAERDAVVAQFGVAVEQVERDHLVSYLLAAIAAGKQMPASHRSGVHARASGVDRGHRKTTTLARRALRTSGLARRPFPATCPSWPP